MNRNAFRDALIAALWLGGDLDVPGHCELVADIVLAMPEIQTLLANEAEIERLRTEFSAVLGDAIAMDAEIERLRAEAWALAQDLFFMGAEVDKFAGENYEQYCEIERLRAERDAIDTLHHPVPSGKHDEVCNHCIGFWPCTTHLLLHPEEARRER